MISFSSIKTVHTKIRIISQITTNWVEICYAQDQHIDKHESNTLFSKLHLSFKITLSELARRKSILHKCLENPNSLWTISHRIPLCRTIKPCLCQIWPAGITLKIHSPDRSSNVTCETKRIVIHQTVHSLNRFKYILFYGEWKPQKAWWRGVNEPIISFWVDYCFE